MAVLNPGDDDDPRRSRASASTSRRSSTGPATSRSCEAVALRHNDIGTEHLLLGLVRQGDVIVRDTLLDAGVDTSTLRDDSPRRRPWGRTTSELVP